MALTRIALINVALKQAGLDTGFQSDARTWLNLVLQDQAQKFNWPEWAKSTAYTAFVPGTSTYALPSDFQKADTIYLYQLNNGEYQRGEQIVIVDSYRFDEVNWLTLSGTPNVAYIDEDNDVIQFNSKPNNSQQGFKMRYYKEAPEYSTSSSDDSVVPDFKDQNYLIKELVKWMYEFEDDQRYEAKKAENERDLDKNKRNVFQNDASPSMQLQNTTFRGRRRNRW
jgi:hypothetical protein